MIFSSLASLEVVMLTTSSAASDENFIKMLTLPFQCIYMYGFLQPFLLCRTKHSFIVTGPPLFPASGLPWDLTAGPDDLLTGRDVALLEFIDPPGQ